MISHVSGYLSARRGKGLISNTFCHAKREYSFSVHPIGCTPAFSCAPGGARFLRVKVPNPPGSGKDIAEGKGVHREVESEGSRMWE